MSGIDDQAQRIEESGTRSASPSLDTPSEDPSVTFLLDFSKNLITEPILATLLDLVREADVETVRDKMFSGEHINTSEDRAVLHVARATKISEAGVDEVGKVLAHIKEFTESVRSGTTKGYTSKTINTIVNIGIGGSDLGPVMVTKALKPYAKRDLTAHFVSNINGTHLPETLHLCDPETSLARRTPRRRPSRTRSARDWFLATAKDKAHVAKHFVALHEHEGGHCVRHLRVEHVPVLGRRSVHPLERHRSAVLGILYNDFYGAQTHALLPYDQYLHKFADYSTWSPTASPLPSLAKRVNFQTGVRSSSLTFMCDVVAEGDN